MESSNILKMHKFFFKCCKKCFFFNFRQTPTGEWGQVVRHAKKCGCQIRGGLWQEQRGGEN